MILLHLLIMIKITSGCKPVEPPDVKENCGTGIFILNSKKVLPVIMNKTKTHLDTQMHSQIFISPKRK